MVKRFGGALFTAAFMLGLGVQHGAAQLTTGALSGSVRDEQTAAVAGATIFLISETRGTRLPNAISSSDSATTSD